MSRFDDEVSRFTGTNDRDGTRARIREPGHCPVPFPVPFYPPNVPIEKSKLILALDPGTTQTGWVVYCACGTDECGVQDSGVMENHQVLEMLKTRQQPGMRLAVEMIASYGMAVGAEVFMTCVWIGRFQQAWHSPADVQFVYRKDVKMHLCGTPRAKDTNVWQALVDKFGPVGTKKVPGALYGVKSHARAALAVAVTAVETAS